MVKSAQLKVLEQVSEIVGGPIARLSLAPGCHPHMGFTVSLVERDRCASLLCAECGEVKLRLPLLATALTDSAAAAALGLVNAQRILQRRDGEASELAAEFGELATDLAHQLERGKASAIPTREASELPAQLQVLELVERHGHAAVLAALAAVKGVHRA